MSECPHVGDREKWSRQPAHYRRAMSSDILNSFVSLLKAHAGLRAEFIELNDLVAYVGVKQQIEDSIIFWRREMQRAAWETRNRKPAVRTGAHSKIMAHGCAAVASLAGSFSDALNRSGNAGKVAT